MTAYYKRELKNAKARAKRAAAKFEEQGLELRIDWSKFKRADQLKKLRGTAFYNYLWFHGKPGYSYGYGFAEMEKEVEYKVEPNVYAAYSATVEMANKRIKKHGGDKFFVKQVTAASNEALKKAIKRIWSSVTPSAFNKRDQQAIHNFWKSISWWQFIDPISYVYNKIIEKNLSDKEVLRIINSQPAKSQAVIIIFSSDRVEYLLTGQWAHLLNELFNLNLTEAEMGVLEVGEIPNDENMEAWKTENSRRS